MAERRCMKRESSARKSASSGDRHIGTGSLFWLLMIFLLVTSTAACSKQPATPPPPLSTPGPESATSAVKENGEKPAEAAQPSSVPQAPPTEPVVVPSKGGEVITFATYSFLEEAYKPVLQEFQRQYPMITVQVRELPATLDTRQIASAADTMLLMFRPPAGGSHFLDLTPLEEGDPGFEPKNFWPGILEACRDGQGKTYGLPVFAEPAGVYYQEKAFEDAGLPLPGPGWTWEDFQKDAKSLARTEAGLPVYGFADDSFMDTPDETLLSPRISYLLAQTGGDIDVKRFEKELQWYLNQVKAGSLYSANIYPQQSPVLASENKEAWSSAWNKTWFNYHEMFLKHPPAMWKGRLDQIFWSDVDMKALPDGSLNMSAASGPIIQSKAGIGWAPYPVSADGQNDHTTPSTVTCAAISAGSEHPRAAWTWLSFLAAHPILPDWSLAVPAQPSAAEAIGYWGKKIPEKLREPVQFGLEHGWYSNPYPQAVLAVNQALLKAVAENADLPAALVEVSSQVETAVQPTPDANPIVVAPPAPTAVPGATTIDYFPLFFGMNERAKSLAEDFHKLHPDITVQVAAPSPVNGAAELAGAYDCFAWLPEKGLPAEQLYDLNQFLLTEKMDASSEYPPEAVDEFSQDGKLFGLPTAYRPYLLYYNADLLARLGLKPPAANWTYTDFLELIRAASSGAPASSAEKPIYGLALEYLTPDLNLFLAGRNARLVDPAGGAPAYLFDTLETRNALQWLAEQVKAGVIFPVTPVTIGSHQPNLMTARSLILDGRVAFWMSPYYQDRGSSYSLQEAGFTIGVAPVPLPGGRVPWRPNHLAIGQYISRKATNPQVPRACWDWIKFLSEQPESSFGVPARRSVRESKGWLDQVGAGTDRVYQAALEQRRIPSDRRIYALGPAGDWWNEVLAEVVNGADPLPLLGEIQKKADVYSACLAASADYPSGNAQQKAQAETTCAERANQK